MPENQDYATKQDVQLLRSDVDALGSEVKTLGSRVDALGSEVKTLGSQFEALRSHVDSRLDQFLEATRDMQTEVLRAFHNWARPTEVKFRSHEERITLLEERISEIERHRPL